VESRANGETSAGAGCTLKALQRLQREREDRRQVGIALSHRRHVRARDHSSRPRRLRRPTPSPLIDAVAGLRRQRWTGCRIASHTGLSRPPSAASCAACGSTASAIWSRLPWRSATSTPRPETCFIWTSRTGPLQRGRRTHPRRYEPPHARPGLGVCPHRHRRPLAHRLCSDPAQGKRPLRCRFPPGCSGLLPAPRRPRAATAH